MTNLRELIIDYIKTHSTIAGGVIELNSLTITILNSDPRNISIDMINEEIDKLVDENILTWNENNHLITTEYGYKNHFS